MLLKTEAPVFLIFSYVSFCLLFVFKFTQQISLIPPLECWRHRLHWPVLKIDSVAFPERTLPAAGGRCEIEKRLKNRRALSGSDRKRGDF